MFRVGKISAPVAGGLNNNVIGNSTRVRNVLRTRCNNARKELVAPCVRVTNLLGELRAGPRFESLEIETVRNVGCFLRYGGTFEKVYCRSPTANIYRGSPMSSRKLRNSQR